jgi:bromodomain-containing protein 7
MEVLTIGMVNSNFCACSIRYSIERTSVEDPFTLFTDLVPEPFSIPDMLPLYPTPSEDDLTTNTPQQPSHLPAPTVLLTSRIDPPAILINPAKRKHWTITRNASVRGRHKDAVDSEELGPAHPQPRPPVHTDFGAIATLPMRLAQETGVAADALKTQELLLQALRASLAASPRKAGESSTADYWNLKALHEAEEYIRDVVYGGTDGYAYIRSLAEYVSDAPAVRLTAYISFSTRLSFVADEG